jgi:predicted MPP superfamily phosphohydrolase
MPGYTSNGAGVTGIPLRYNCSPELALITLRQPLKDLD